MLAILFGALAPFISHALAAAGLSTDTTQICTVNGYKLVKLVGSDDNSAPRTDEHGMEHCVFCGTHGGSHALPAACLSTVARNAAHDTYPPLFYSAPHRLNAWTAGEPRGPPCDVM